MVESPIDGKVSNEKKNLNRLAGEFLVVSRLTQRGYMVSLQWGTTISYDILAFDKKGHVAFIEVKSSASYSRRWMLQKKFAQPSDDQIPLKNRFVCCVDLTCKPEPTVYVFPASEVARGLKHFFREGFPDSPSYHFSLDFRPPRSDKATKTVGEEINADSFKDNYLVLGLEQVPR